MNDLILGMGCAAICILIGYLLGRFKTRDPSNSIGRLSNWLKEELKEEKKEEIKRKPYIAEPYTKEEQEERIRMATNLEDLLKP